MFIFGNHVILSTQIIENSGRWWRGPLKLYRYFKDNRIFEDKQVLVTSTCLVDTILTDPQFQPMLEMLLNFSRPFSIRIRHTDSNG